jgi:hypothetical protein
LRGTRDAALGFREPHASHAIEQALAERLRQARIEVLGGRHEMSEDAGVLNEIVALLERE